MIHSMPAIWFGGNWNGGFGCIGAVAIRLIVQDGDPRDLWTDFGGHNFGVVPCHLHATRRAY